MAKCARCGRKLTNPVSIARGLGSECAGSRSGSRPLKNWERKVINSACARNGQPFPVSTGGDEFIVVSSDNYEKMKLWLTKYNYILKEGEVSDEILDKVYNNPEEFFGEGDNNGEEQRRSI